MVLLRFLRPSGNEYQMKNPKHLTKPLLFLPLLCCAILHVSVAQNKKEWQWEGNPQKQASLLLFGDTNIQNREKPEDAFANVQETFARADFRICNLEGPFAGTSKDPRIPDIPHKTGWKHSEPEMVKALVAAKVDAVGVANNVTYPWMSLLKSLAVLRQNNIPFTGGGENIAEAHKPVILEKKGVRVGLLAYACTVFPFQHAATADIPGIASVRVDTYYKPVPNLDKPGMNMITVTIPVPAELQLMRNDIRELRKKVDVVIVSFHWGIAENTTLLDYQKEIAHEAIEAGADVIMGHGNHLLGAIEVYKDKPVFYGLGNFAFDWQKMLGRTEGILVKVDFVNKKVDRVSFVPVDRDKNNNVYLLDPRSVSGQVLVEKLTRLSANRSALKVAGKEVIVSAPSGLPN